MTTKKSLNEQQFEAFAQLMRLRPSKSRQALKNVLVDGMTHTAAADKVGIPRSNVSRQAANANHALQLMGFIASEQ